MADPEGLTLNTLIKMLGDNRRAAQLAHRVNNLFQYTPLGIPSAAYQAGQMIGHGFQNRSFPQTALGLGAAAMTALPAARGVLGPAETKLIPKIESEAENLAASYRGAHTAAGPESGSPLHNVTANGTYPEDFYGPNGLRYYGTGDEKNDAVSYAKIRAIAGKPDEPVAIWRAVPNLSGAKGKDPVTRNSSHIRPGDWVTISRQYAIDHGESALNGNYSLVKGVKPAKELYTSGDSFHEWGWFPGSTE